MESDRRLTPANLLALTFSKKAALEMQQRVEALLGATADELGIFTFHGFCHRFLQDYALEIGLPTRFRLLDQTESWIFFRRLLPELKLSHYWNLSDPTNCIDGFLRFISRAKDELVTPDDYAVYFKSLTDPQERSKAQEIERVYRTYQRQMRAQGALDFGDLIVETLQVLAKNPTLRAEWKARYRYLLVDEFQDTNVAQIELLKCLAGESGNLCVVGDDDQAIYRFRGASFASFLLMKEAFPAVETIRLTQNYRSTPEILSVAERLIRHNEPDRYDPQKRLWTQDPNGNPIEVIVCRDEADEAQKVVKTIRAIYEGQPAEDRRFDRIAILYRAHAHRDRLLETLRLSEIPFFVEAGEALFDQPEIKDLVAFLKVLADWSDSVSMFRILSHPIWGIPPEDLMRMTRWAKERQLPLNTALKEMISLKEGANLAVGATSQAAVRRLCEEISRMEREAVRKGVGTLVPHLVEETSFRTIFREGESLSFLGRFLQFTDRYVENYPQAQDLGSFLWYLESAIQAGSNPMEEEISPIGNRVRLMTVHRAKGLEFEWVILLGMIQGRFPTRGRPEPISFPVQLMKEPLPQGDFHLQEERRLCYVGSTRAQRGLFLMTQERAYHRPSLFVREMLEGASEEEILRREPQVEAGSESSPVSTISGSTATSFPIPDKFSFTQLETYRYCPLKYQYSVLYQIPVRPTPQMTFGSDLHACLEAFFKKVMAGVIPPLSELLDRLRSFHLPGRYGEPYQDTEYQRLGVELLTAFYRKHEGHFVAPLLVEKSFLLALEDAWIRGVMDRVDSLPEGGVEIIDYKTGKPKQEADPQEQLQLRLYALASQEVFQLETRKVSFYYLQNNEKLSFEHRPEILQQTREQILKLIRAIRSGDFAPTPSVMKCRRCDFKGLCPSSMA